MPFPIVAVALAAFDMSDVSKYLIIVMFVVVPIVNKVIAAARKKTASQPPAPRPPTRAAAGTPARPFSWEDLISGRMPEREPAASPPEETPVHAELAGRDSADFDASAPEPMFAEAPTENELEATGGDKGPLSSTPWEAGAVATLTGRSPWRPRRGEWRRALVWSVLLAVPVSMRPKGSFPGPPLGLL
ncbi:MAG: hypothetical protein E2O39_10615 [Planctomycetota bacterium]|nr:MAG: hypothetical protein E2O39_10615 [Planctomycetota bacterium]